MSPQVLSAKTYFIIWLTQLFFLQKLLLLEKENPQIVDAGGSQRRRKTQPPSLSIENTIFIFWSDRPPWNNTECPKIAHRSFCSIERKTVKRKYTGSGKQNLTQNTWEIFSPCWRWIAPVKGESFISIVLPLTWDKSWQGKIFYGQIVFDISSREFVRISGVFGHQEASSPIFNPHKSWVRTIMKHLDARQAGEQCILSRKSKGGERTFRNNALHTQKDLWTFTSLTGSLSLTVNTKLAWTKRKWGTESPNLIVCSPIIFFARVTFVKSHDQQQGDHGSFWG